jgi:hypothetical protein
MWTTSYSYELSFKIWLLPWHLETQPFVYYDISYVTVRMSRAVRAFRENYQILNPEFRTWRKFVAYCVEIYFHTYLLNSYYRKKTSAVLRECALEENVREWLLRFDRLFFKHNDASQPTLAVAAVLWNQFGLPAVLSNISGCLPHSFRLITYLVPLNGPNPFFFQIIILWNL